MNDLKVEYLPIDELKEYKHNAKKHTAEQVEQIANSIEAFGMNDPIAVDEDNTIIEGHGRLYAIKKLRQDGKYAEDTVPVIRLMHLTDQQKKAYILAHNKLTMNTGFDLDVLSEELSRIKDFDMDDFGFIDDYANKLEEGETEEDEYEVPEQQEDTRVKPGDVWQLGRHRLICGDSTDAGTAEKLMGSEKAKMLFTSPPYSDMREYNGDKDLSVNNLTKFISVFRPYTDYQCINLGIQRKDNDINQYWDEYIKVARDAGYKMLAWNVWDKLSASSIGQANAFFPIRHEWIFVFGTEFFEINFTVEKKARSIIKDKTTGLVRQKDGSMKRVTKGVQGLPLKQAESVTKLEPLGSVLEMLPERGSISHLHPATFPVGLPGEYIKSMTKEKDIVIEPFGGSGTTLIACEQLNRRCRIVELDARYCDIILSRWEQYTGKKAERLNG